MTEQIPLGYKKTEIGIIPEDWEVKRLGEIFDISAGGDVDKNDFSLMKTSKFRYPIYSNSLENNGLYGYSNIYEYEGNCITVTARGTLGVAIPRYEKFNAIIRLLVLRPKCSLDIKFISEFINEKVNFSIESTGVPQLTAPRISKYLVSLPTLHEQRAISRVLSDIDHLIESLDKLIEKKKLIKKGAMQLLLTGKKRLPGFKGEWVRKKLGEVTDCLDDHRIPLNESQRKKMRGTIPYCGANGILDYVNDYTIDDDIILLAEDGGHFDEFEEKPIAYRMKGKCWVNNHAHIIKAKEGYSQDFLFYSLVHKDIREYIGGGTRSKLNKSEMFKIEIDFPSTLKEQRAIAQILSDMDAEIEALERKKQKYEMIKRGAMELLLTGKIRLKDHINEVLV